MTARSLDGLFGRAYRQAVYAANPPPPASVLRLVPVLVDLAYVERSTTVHPGWRFLCDETALHGRSLERARDWLVEHELLAYRVNGIGRGARSEWELLLR